MQIVAFTIQKKQAGRFELCSVCDEGRPAKLGTYPTQTQARFVAGVMAGRTFKGEIKTLPASTH